MLKWLSYLDVQFVILKTKTIYAVNQSKSRLKVKKGKMDDQGRMMIRSPTQKRVNLQLNHQKARFKQQ